MYSEKIWLWVFSESSAACSVVVYGVRFANKQHRRSEQSHVAMYSIDGNDGGSNADRDAKG